MDISIIIPFYNSEAYLKRCLMSIFTQDVAKFKFEVICIDDCSTDMSSQIVKDFRTIHKNTHLYTHRKNKKQGAARNLGLRKSKGEYVWFIDSDDFIEDNVLNKLLSKLNEHTPDILQFNSFKVLQNGTKRDGYFWKEEVIGLSGLKYLEKEMKEEYSERILAVWSKVFRRNFLIGNNLFFKEGIYWEDVAFTLKAFIRAESIVYIPINAYNYVLTQGSDIRSSYDGRKVADSIRFCIDVTNIAHKDITNESLRLYIIQIYIPTIMKYKTNIKDLSFDDYAEFETIVENIENKGVLVNYMSEEVYGWLVDKKERQELYKA